MNSCSTSETENEKRTRRPGGRVLFTIDEPCESNDEARYVMGDTHLTKCVQDMMACDAKLEELESIPESERTYEQQMHIDALKRTLNVDIGPTVKAWFAKRQREYRERRKQLAAQARQRAERMRSRVRCVRVHRGQNARSVHRVGAARPIAATAPDDPDGSSEPPRPATPASSIGGGQ